MKKLLVALLSLMLILAFAACGNTTEEAATDEASAIDAEELIYGTLTLNGATEEELNAWIDKNVESVVDIAFEAVFYDDLNSMILALDKGDIDVIESIKAMADYIMSAYPDKYTYDMPDNFMYSYAMAVADDNTELLTKLNEAIAALKEDGTLDTLKEQYIDNVDANAMPEPAELPYYEGAETITVVVTGDMPPMDYMNTEGKAAGYNISLLSAIAEKAQLNMELVSANSGSRAMMISSGKADVIFWCGSIHDLEDNADLAEGLALTNVYLEQEVGYLSLAE